MLELLQLHGHQVFLRRDALDHGYDDRDMSRELKLGRIARVRWGAYTAFDLWHGSDPVAQHVLRSHAVLLTHGQDVVLSHTSAALMHGIDCWQPDLRRIHLTRLDGSASRVCRDVIYHRGSVPDDQITPLASGALATTRVRAAIETATISSVEQGLVTIDSFLHQGRHASLDEIAAAHLSRPSWPGNRRLNITLRLARPGAQSVGETRMRFLMWEHHLPEPELQYVVTDKDGTMIGATDFAWAERRLLGEFDGKVKYTTLIPDGDTPGDVVFREKRREDRIRERTGFSMIRFVWSDLSSRQRTAERIRVALGRR